MQASLRMIQAAGKGALVYLRQESRGLALLHRLDEFKKSVAVRRWPARRRARRESWIGGILGSGRF